MSILPKFSLKVTAKAVVLIAGLGIMSVLANWLVLQRLDRLDDINEFESFLADNDVLILKFYLHISRDEQTRRLQARIDNPKKHWKLSDADIHERQFWPQYMAAYNDLLSATSRKHAPWFVIPSDHKWYRNVAISAIIVDLLQSLKLKYPQPTIDASAIKL